MPSPFPGMDPYLESADAWHDFHSRYVPALGGALMAGLPRQYIIKVEQNVYVRERSAAERLPIGRPDAMVISTPRPEPGARPDPGGAGRGAAAPVVAELAMAAVDIVREPYLEVIDRLSRSVVTVVELLSPSNKSNAADRATYLAKRRHLLRSPAHFVEIDLLRGGPRMPIDGLPACDYCALVSRAEDRPQVGAWPIGVRDRLPVLTIPLGGGDGDVLLDLRPAMDRVYGEAEYDRYIYADLPDPPLSPADAAWAAGLVGTVASH